MEKQIDKVTVDNLDVALRAYDIELSKNILDRLIDVFELLLEKGDDATLVDICELKKNWL